MGFIIIYGTQGTARDIAVENQGNIERYYFNKPQNYHTKQTI